MDSSIYRKSIMQLAELIYKADAVVVGCGSGLSSAAGYNHYHWMPYFENYMQEFIECYGFKSPFEGFYYCYSSPEQQWAYYSKYIQAMKEAPTGQPYLDLKDVLDGKEKFIISTNVDGQCERVFPNESICSYQGDMNYFQCSQPCHDEIYENTQMLSEMICKIKGVRIDSEAIPRCKECGRMLVPWVRDDTFLEGTEWKAGVRKYEGFLQKYMINEPDKKVLLLELGVGEMTPSIIKLPFWDMTAKNKNVFYACLNQKQSTAPEHLKGKSLYIANGLKESLHTLRMYMNGMPKNKEGRNPNDTV